MQQDRQDAGALGVVFLALLGADLAQNHGVHGLQMAGIGSQRQMHFVVVKFTVGAGAKMVFHITRAFDISWLETAALKLVENGAVGFAHHIGKHAKAAAMRHADDDFFHPKCTTALDDLFHRRDQSLAAIKAEPFGAHIFDMQEFLETLGFDQLVQNGFTAILGKQDFLAVAFDPFLQPTGFFRVGDVHILQREGATIGAFHDRKDFAHRRDFKPQHVIKENRPIHGGLGKAIGAGVKLGMGFVAVHFQRVKVGGQVTPDTIGPDQHQRPQAVQNRLLHFGVGQGDTFFLGLGFDFFGGFLRLKRPLAVKGCGQVVIGDGRPVSAVPGRACGFCGDVGFGIPKRLEPGLPTGIHRIGISGVTGIKLFNVFRVMALQKGRRVKLVIGGLFGHGVTSFPSGGFW